VNELWMRIYTCMMAIFVPFLINIIINFRIFLYARSSARRVQPQAIRTVTTRNNNQQPIINRREISLLKQMIFIFTVFIVGWCPVYLVVIIISVIYIDPIIPGLAVLLGELSTLSVTIYLFIYNHELRQYLLNKIQRFFT
jgi:hypothetical protein